MKKKVIIIVSAAVLLLAVLAAGSWFFFFKGKLEKNKNVDAVEEENYEEFSNVGTSYVFSGVVEPEYTEEVKKDSDKTVGEIFVTTGQIVKGNDPLFTYDVDALELSLEQANLELEGIDNQIKQLEKQIEDLTKAKEKAKQEDQVTLLLEINGAELDLRTQEYNYSVKTREIERLSSDIENAVVVAPTGGVIKSIKEMATSEDAFITILAEGDYRVKGTATELNVGTLYEGMKVLVRSRVNQNVTFDGVITAIDREAAQNDNNMYYMDNGQDKAAKYYFYVKLSAPGELMLGQHVYLEIESSGMDLNYYTEEQYYEDPGLYEGGFSDDMNFDMPEEEFFMDDMMETEGE